VLNLRPPHGEPGFESHKLQYFFTEVMTQFNFWKTTKRTYIARISKFELRCHISDLGGFWEKSELWCSKKIKKKNLKKKFEKKKLVKRPNWQVSESMKPKIVPVPVRFQNKPKTTNFEEGAFLGREWSQLKDFDTAWLLSPEALQKPNISSFF